MLVTRTGIADRSNVVIENYRLAKLQNRNVRLIVPSVERAGEAPALHLYKLQYMRIIMRFSVCELVRRTYVKDLCLWILYILCIITAHWGQYNFELGSVL